MIFIGRAKTVIFWIFHITAKIAPAAIAFNISERGWAHEFSGGVYNIYLLAGYVLLAYAICSCYADYRLLKKDKENGVTEGVKKLLIIDAVPIAAAAALYICYMAQLASFYGCSDIFEFIKFYFDL